MKIITTIIGIGMIAFFFSFTIVVLNKQNNDHEMDQLKETRRLEEQRERLAIDKIVKCVEQGREVNQCAELYSK